MSFRQRIRQIRSIEIEVDSRERRSIERERSRERSYRSREQSRETSLKLQHERSRWSNIKEEFSLKPDLKMSPYDMIKFNFVEHLRKYNLDEIDFNGIGVSSPEMFRIYLDNSKDIGIHSLFCLLKDSILNDNIETFLSIWNYMEFNSYIRSGRIVEEDIGLDLLNLTKSFRVLEPIIREDYEIELLTKSICYRSDRIRDFLLDHLLIARNILSSDNLIPILKRKMFDAIGKRDRIAIKRLLRHIDISDMVECLYALNDSFLIEFAEMVNYDLSELATKYNDYQLLSNINPSLNNERIIKMYNSFNL